MLQGFAVSSHNVGSPEVINSFYKFGRGAVQTLFFFGGKNEQRRTLHLLGVSVVCPAGGSSQPQDEENRGIVRGFGHR